MTSRSKPYSLLYVGCSPQAVEAAQKVILAILNTKATEDATKRVALETLSKLCSVGNTTVSNCNFESS